MTPSSRVCASRSTRSGPPGGPRDPAPGHSVPLPGGPSFGAAGPGGAFLLARSPGRPRARATPAPRGPGAGPDLQHLPAPEPRGAGGGGRTRGAFLLDRLPRPGPPGRLPSLVSEGARIRAEIVEVGRRLYARGLISGNEGNISVREGDHLFITPAGTCKGFLTPEAIVRTDLEGRPEGRRRASTEVLMHTAIYRRRTDAGA